MASSRLRATTVSTQIDKEVINLTVDLHEDTR